MVRPTLKPLTRFAVVPVPVVNRRDARVDVVEHSILDNARTSKTRQTKQHQPTQNKRRPPNIDRVLRALAFVLRIARDVLGEAKKLLPRVLLAGFAGDHERRVEALSKLEHLGGLPR